MHCRVHFYYCLLIAIKLKAREFPRWTSTSKNLFVKGWVDTAKRNNIFDLAINSEINWLRAILKNSSGVKDIESLVENVYRKGCHISSLQNQ